MTGASTTTATMRQRWQAVMMNNYGTPPIALASGDGAVVTDVDGRTYIDLLGGIAVNVLGHRHPAVIEAVTRQMSTLGHTSNLYATEPGIALAEELVALLGADQRTRVFFCNSGAEANEAAFKLSRLTGRTKLGSRPPVRWIWRWCSTRDPTTPPPGCSPATRSRRRRCCGPSKC